MLSAKYLPHVYWTAVGLAGCNYVYRRVSAAEDAAQAAVEDDADAAERARLRAEQAARERAENRIPLVLPATADGDGAEASVGAFTRIGAAAARRRAPPEDAARPPA